MDKPMKKKSIKIKQMNKMDIKDVANIHKKVFIRQSKSLKWIKSNFSAYPKTIYYLACIDEKIVGYIQYTQKSGFRKDAVIELEQIAILKKYQACGIGTKLISKSLKLLNKKLSKRDAYIKHVMVTTRTDNKAKQLYKKTLNVKQEAVLTNLYSHDEVVLISRSIKI